MTAPWNKRLLAELDRQDAERVERTRRGLAERLIADGTMTPERAYAYADTLAGTLGSARKVSGN